MGITASLDPAEVLDAKLGIGGGIKPDDDGAKMEVNEGDTVLTSGLNGTYPKDLVIGKVTGVGTNRQELFRSVTVEPLASLSRLETVLVMTSFVPAQVSPP